ncbi:unnamed protein product [Calypogeia fissa]
MGRNKFFPTSSSRKQSEISLVYQSVTESSLGPGLSAPVRGQYERIGNHDGVSSSGGGSSSAITENRRGFLNGPKTLKLGGNSKPCGPNSMGRASRSRMRLIYLLKAPSNFICKVKEQYARWKDGARSANIRVSDLFVANQVFMHVQATPVNNRRKQQALKPSVGFVTRVAPSASSQRELRER